MASRLEQLVVRTGIARIVAGAAAAVVLALQIAINVSDVQAYRSGPAQLSSAELVKLSAPANELANPWVSFKGEGTVDLGVEKVIVRKRKGVEQGRSSAGRMYAVSVGGRWIVVSAEGSIPTGTLTGKLLPLGGEARSAVELAGTRVAGRSFDAAFLPYLLNTSNTTPSFPVGVALAALLLLAAAVWVASGIAAVRHPQGSPALRGLGQRLAWANQRYDAERGAQRLEIKAGKWTVTESLALRRSLFSLTVKPLDELIWAHGSVTHRKLWGFITTGTDHAAVLYWPDLMATMAGPEKTMRAILEHLSRVVPWVPLGHTPELASAWAGRRPQFVATVQQRRAAAQGAQQPAFRHAA